jgi:hypothetical protein
MTAHDASALSRCDADKSLEGPFKGPQVLEANCKRQVGYVVIVVRQHEYGTGDSLKRDPVLKVNACSVVKVFGEVAFLQSCDVSGLTQRNGFGVVLLHVSFDSRQTYTKEKCRVVGWRLNRMHVTSHLGGSLGRRAYRKTEFSTSRSIES